MTGKRLTIDPLTRLEGHGRVEIFLNPAGKVENAYFIVPELRGFEQFCIGRPAEEMPAITSRICGICPTAHHLASARTLDALYQIEPPRAARLLREMSHLAAFVADHATHFFALAGPDFLVSPQAPPAERHIFAVVRKLGQMGNRIFACRKNNHLVLELLNGRPIHPCAALPGGWAKPLAREDLATIAAIASENVDFALDALRIFEQQVLRQKAYEELFFSDQYTQRTYYAGLVDSRNRINFYEGRIRVIGPEGEELVRYAPQDYTAHIAEHVEPWTYVKFPYLKEIGWQGLVDGRESGVYCSGPLARLNVADSLSTPRAQEFFESFFASFGSGRHNGRYRPVHQRFAMHWARLIELLHAAERMVELARHPEITSLLVRHLPAALQSPRQAVGCLEAPRGLLTHHYATDERGILRQVNLIVGTTNNHAAIAMTIKQAAALLVRPGKPADDALLNQIEMAIRLYDPCLACASHAMPGQMPLEILLRGPDGELRQRLRRGGR